MIFEYFSIHVNPLYSISYIETHLNTLYYFQVIWIIFICLMIFGILNVLTGIFVDAAMRAAANDRTAIVHEQAQRTEEVEKVLRHAFNEIDADKSGFVTYDEYQSLFLNEEVCAAIRGSRPGWINPRGLPKTAQMIKQHYLRNQTI